MGMLQLLATLLLFQIQPDSILTMRFETQSESRFIRKGVSLFLVLCGSIHRALSEFFLSTFNASSNFITFDLKGRL